MNRRDILLAGAGALAACGQADGQGQQSSGPPFPMRRGVNLGNALEAPAEGEWGYRIERAHIAAIAEAGFDGVRLPVRWQTHFCARDQVCADWMTRVRQVVGWALADGLMVQLNVHHYEALIEQPARERHRFLELWRQIAEAFAQAPPALLFEPLNEPHGAYWRGDRLAALQRDAIETIRRSNPTRTIVLGPGNWQNIDRLAHWPMPRGENVHASVHYYEPHAFTHERAEWLGEEAPSFGRAWGTEADIAAVREHIAIAARWSRAQNVAMQLGEFGVNTRLPLAQRAAWTRTVREACDANAMGWCAWDFAGAFPVWDRERRAFIPEMLEALFQ